MLIRILFTIILASNAVFSGWNPFTKKGWEQVGDGFKKMGYGIKGGFEKMGKAFTPKKKAAPSQPQKVEQKFNYAMNFADGVFDKAYKPWTAKKDSEGDDFFEKDPAKRLPVFLCKQGFARSSGSAVNIKSLLGNKYLSSTDITNGLSLIEKTDDQSHAQPATFGLIDNGSGITTIAIGGGEKQETALNWEIFTAKSKVDFFWINSTSKTLENVTNKTPVTQNILMQIKSQDDKQALELSADELKAEVANAMIFDGKQKVTEKHLKQLWVVDISMFPDISYSSFTAQTHDEAKKEKEPKIYSQKQVLQHFRDFFDNNQKLINEFNNDTLQPLIDHVVRDPYLKYLPQESPILKDIKTLQNEVESISVKDLLIGQILRTIIPDLDTADDSKLIPEFQKATRDKDYFYLITIKINNISSRIKQITDDKDSETRSEFLGNQLEKAGATVEVKPAANSKETTTAQANYALSFASEDIFKKAYNNWTASKETDGDDFYEKDPSKRQPIYLCKGQPLVYTGSAFQIKNLFTKTYLGLTNLDDGKIVPLIQRENDPSYQTPSIFALISKSGNTFSIALSDRGSTQTLLATDWQILNTTNDPFNPNSNKVEFFWINSEKNVLENVTTKTPITQQILMQIKSQDDTLALGLDKDNANAVRAKAMIFKPGQEVTEEHLKQLWVLNVVYNPNLKYSSATAETDEAAQKEGKVYSQKAVLKSAIRFVEDNKMITQNLTNNLKEGILGTLASKLQVTDSIKDKVDKFVNSIDLSPKRLGIASAISSFGDIDINNDFIRASDNDLIDEFKKASRDKNSMNNILQEMQAGIENILLNTEP